MTEPDLMSDLRFHEDDWSLQVTLLGSPRFFIRLKLPLTQNGEVTFSDFRFDQHEGPNVVEALICLFEGFAQPSRAVDFVFLDVLPAADRELDRIELAIRQRQLFAAISDYAFEVGCVIQETSVKVVSGKVNARVTIVDATQSDGQTG